MTDLSRDRMTDCLLTRRAALAGLAAAPLLGASPPSSGAMAEDLGVLRAALAIHPGLHRYLTPAGVERSVAAFGRAYAAAGTLEGRYLALARLLATLRCGHSYPNFFNQREAVAGALFDRPTRVPFHFVWLGRDMVVTADHSGTGALPPGTRVLALNGLTAGALLDRLLPYTRADGHNDAKRRSLLGVEGRETLETFDVFQGLLLPPVGGVHRLSVAPPGGAARRVELPAVGPAVRQARLSSARADRDAPRWTYAVRPDGVAVLTMPDWALYNSRWDWRAWLADRLDDANAARGLVIDLRGNEGGDDCGDPILARLIDRDLSGGGFVARLRFREVPAALRPHVSTWDDSFYRLGVGGADLGDGWYARPDAQAPEPIRRDGRRLRVPVAALVGPANSSATFGFASAARQSGRIRLFGEPTGGNRRGINGGAFLFTTLPGSGIEFDLPLIGYFPNGVEPDAGLVPDVFVPRTAATIAAGTDPALDSAAAWARARG